MKHIWIWNSPDGPILFSSKAKGVAYVNRLWSGGGTWLKKEDSWEFWATEDQGDEDPTAALYKEDVH